MATALMALQALVAIVAAILVAVGGALLVAPQRALSRAAAWLAPEEPARGTGVSLERLFYRHHRLFGAGIALGAVYILYFLVFHFSPVAISELLLADVADGAIRTVLERLSQWLLFFGALLAFAVGLLLAVRPSVLKPMETLVHLPLRLRGWRRLTVQPAAARACGAGLIALGLCLSWLAGPSP